MHHLVRWLSSLCNSGMVPIALIELEMVSSNARTLAP
jgi:hypothetical protein